MAAADPVLVSPSWRAFHVKHYQSRSHDQDASDLSPLHASCALSLASLLSVVPELLVAVYLSIPVKVINP